MSNASHLAPFSEIARVFATTKTKRNEIVLIALLYLALCHKLKIFYLVMVEIHKVQKNQF